MNRYYRVVWNANRGLWVVAGELAKSKVKSSASSAMGQSRAPDPSSVAPKLKHSHRLCTKLNPYYAAIFSLMMPVSAMAATATWDGNTSAAWEYSGNWDVAPASTDDAVINNAGATNQPTVTTTETVNTVTLDAGSLTISTGGSLTATNGTTVNGGTLTAEGTLDGNLAINNNATVRGSSIIAGGITYGNSSTVSAITGTTLTLNGAFTTTTANAVLRFGSASDTGVVQLRANGVNIVTNIRISVDGGTLQSMATNISTITKNILSTTVAADAIFDIGNFDTTINALAGAGTITTSTASARKLTLQGNSTFSGVIEDGAGTLSLEKINAGTVTLTGANTYTGDTTISNGTLQLGGNNRIANTSDLVINGGTFDLNGYDEAVANLSGAGGVIDLGDAGTAKLTVNQTVDATYVGDFVGHSNNFNNVLTKNGAATLTLSGNSTQTGFAAVVINAGRLAVSGGNAIADSYYVYGTGEFELLSDETILGIALFSSSNSSNILLNDNTLTLNTSSELSSFNSGVISGTGNIVIEGNGTQGFKGASTYTGSTTINGGRLITNDSSALGSNGTVTVNGPGRLELLNNLAIGSLAGDGAVNLSGYGTNTLTTGANNFSTLFSGVLSGIDGALTKTGTGNLNLTGLNTYTGTTTINGGILSVNGSIANSATTVNASGQLGGNGTVGSVTLGGGTIAPGNSIGTLNVNGNVDFTGGGVYAVEVDATGNTDLITASGTATLTNGSVQVKPEAGSYNVSTDYTILTATGGLIGTFGSISSDLAFLTPSLSYDATNVFLNLRRNLSDYATVSATANQMAVGTMLDSVFSSGDDALDPVFNNLNTLTTTGAQQSYDSLSGVQHTYSSLITLNAINQFKGLLFNRLHSSNTALTQSGQFKLAYNDGDIMSDVDSPLFDNTPEPNRHWWFRATGQHGTIDSTANASGAKYNAGGVASGLDISLNDKLTVGAAFGYTHSDADVEQGGLDINSYQTALYSQFLLNDNYYATSLAGLGYHNINANRLISVGLLNSVATADYAAWTGNIAIETGRQFALNPDSTITPFVGLDYAYSRRDSFTETGSDLTNLSVKTDNQTALSSVIGARIAHNWTSRQGYLIQPSAELAWVHDFIDTNGTLRAGFESTTHTSFLVKGPELNRDHARVGLGLNVTLSKMTSLNLNYQGEIAGSDNRHDISATVKVAW